mmetsp:Transcript_34240/g.50336  ORF Transcript_34240/g.50336 Transcript_34240/m.50336 type:complete len:102 (-) Transcript_34240:444-749(-)
MKIYFTARTSAVSKKGMPWNETHTSVLQFSNYETSQKKYCQAIQNQFNALESIHRHSILFYVVQISLFDSYSSFLFNNDLMSLSMYIGGVFGAYLLKGFPL